MSVRQTKGPGKAPWSLDDIAYHEIPVDQIRPNRHLFYLVTSASFVEATSDLYTENLAAFFADDPEVLRWLREEWEPEELQHGAALRRYVETVWPEFDWAAAYQKYFDEYSPQTGVVKFAATQSLELAGRCVVETGTASFYRMLEDSEPEPVLRQIAHNISLDEVRHYKYFYHYFNKYSEIEKPGTRKLISILWSRATQINAHDAYYAFKHTYLGANGPDAVFHQSDYGAFREGVRELAKHHFPREMAIKMLLKPLGLGRRTSQVVIPLTSFAAKHLVLHQ